MSSSNLARRIAATSTLSSWRSVPHVSFVFEPDVTQLYNHYLENKESFSTKENTGLSFNTLLVKIIADTLADFPKLYSSFEYHRLTHRLEYTIKDTVDINVPWLLPSGEMIPFRLKDVSRMTLSELAKEIDRIRMLVTRIDIDPLMLRAAIRDTMAKLKRFKLTALTRVIPLLAAKVRNRARVNSDQMRDADLINPDGIVISNVGSLLKGIRGSFSLLEIIEPKIMAIGISSADERLRPPHDESSKYAISKILPITIAFDHRALDFSDIVPFISKLERKLSEYAIP